jgi:hypothetical protein
MDFFPTAWGKGGGGRGGSMGLVSTFVNVQNMHFNLFLIYS